ncbi:MAG: hypothetical protein GX428_12870 [Candidatus Atribacteria bacterium]|nr:hypothetical protein [Candidatus Atribacteria bacterium]
MVYPLSFCLLQFFSSYAVGCYPVIVYRIVFRIDGHGAFAAPDEDENQRIRHAMACRYINRAQ